MAFKRKIYSKLLEWKNEKPKNSALLIEGARRIGKTTICEEFAKNEYNDYIIVDFMYATQEMKDLFKNLNNLNLFFSNFFLLVGKTLSPGDLIIFDEIQHCPLARQGIKKFVQDGRFDYIETGSLLSIRDNTENITIPSEERRIEMFPMDYEEFLWAFGNDSTATILHDIYNNNLSIDNKTHEKLLNDFRLYLALGGMPKVISLFQSSLSYIRAHEEKNDIIKLYKDDLLKHDLKYKTKCRILYDAIPSELSKVSTRFIVSKNLNNERGERIQDSIYDLSDSKCANIVYNTTDLSYSFELNKNSNMFKIYSSDTGLFVSSIIKDCDDSIDNVYKKIIFDRLNSNFGRIFESLVSQSLITNGIIPYYHTFVYNNKKYELDFVYNKNGKTYVVEVKSGKNFTTSSLDMVSEKYKSIKFKKIVISTKPFKNIDNTLYLPLYMLFCL